MNSRELQRQAEHYYQSGSLPEALEAYTMLCSLDPSDAQAWHMQAAISGMLGNFENTVDCCEKALALAPAALAIYKNYASALIELSRFAEARTALVAALELDSADTDVMVMLGNVCLLMHDHGEAEKYFTGILGAFPGHPLAANGLARIMIASGNYSRAESICETALAQHPDQSQLLLTLIESRFYSGSASRCRSAIKKYAALASSPASDMAGIIRNMNIGKNYALAIAAGDLLISIFQEEQRFYLALARSQASSGLNAAAIHTIKKCKPLLHSYKALILLATAYHHDNDIDNSAACLLQAASVSPDAEEPVAMLSQLYLQDGKPEAALRHLVSFTESHPEAYQLLIEAGNIHYRSGNYEDAAKYYRRAIESQPGNASAYNCLGLVYLNEKQEANAQQCFKASIQLDPGLIQPYCNLALLQRTSGDIDQAIATYNQALEIDPDSDTAISGIAAIHERTGNTQAAIELLEPRLKKPSTDSNILLAYANVCHKAGKERVALELMSRAIENPMTALSERMQLHFSMGKILDRLGDYDNAFMHYKRGNDLNSTPFDRDAQLRLTNTTISIFSDRVMKLVSKSTNDHEGLMFIVGMPRSGTTLTEQILSSHPDVFGAGELEHIANIASAIPGSMRSTQAFPLYIPDVSRQILDQYSFDHVKALQSLAQGKRIITDKMPSNFMFLGLIELLFPRARVIHCTRDPMDTCISCYFQQFSRGQYFSYDQADLALYYKLYRRLMKHWKSTLTIPVMDVQYEELVADTEGLSKRMLAFSGLNWNPACAEFYRSNRKIFTASYDQVRRPIYNTSVGRWKNYKSHLSILCTELAEFYD